MVTPMFCILAQQKAFPCAVAGTIYWSGFCLAPNGDPRSLSRSRILVLSSTSTFRSVRREWSAMHKRLEERRMRADATAADRLLCRRWSELVSVMIFGGRMQCICVVECDIISFSTRQIVPHRVQVRNNVGIIMHYFGLQYNHHIEYAISSQYKTSPHTENVSLKRKLL